MKIQTPAFLNNFWVLLTEVPGWADAPLGARLRRMLPIALPFLAIICLLVWNLAWYRPQVLAERDTHAPLIALESEIESLQMTNSEQQALELTTRTAEVNALLLKPAEELAPLLDSMKKEAAARGWEVSFYPSEIPTPSAESTAQVAYLPVRVKLAPKADNTEVYTSLLALLERLSTTKKRIDLMRLTIRADENRWLSVEGNLRIACPVHP